MIKFLGLLSKKKKIRAIDLAPIYVSAIENVISEGFLEMSDFINNNNNFERSPALTKSDIDWFRNVVFLANISNLSSFLRKTKLQFLELSYLNIDIKIFQLMSKIFLWKLF